jgi:hypothetical protein
VSTRTSRFIIRFSSPFLLNGFDVPQPAGEYRVEQDEESIDGNSWLAFRRVATFIHLPAIGSQILTSQVVQISPAELNAALERDQQQA